jgi:NADPH:quinone reductase
MTQSDARAVRFDRYGNRNMRYVAEVPMPTSAAGEVVVAVKAAEINPGEVAIRFRCTARAISRNLSLRGGE